MRLIKPNFSIIEQESSLDGIYKQIELAGRTCYKSEDKITTDSAKKFVDMIISRDHGAMLEHGTVYLKAEHDRNCPLAHYKNNKYSNYYTFCEVSTNNEDNLKFYYYEYVTTNYRVLVENGWLDDLKYLCEPTKYHEKRVTVKFTCSRGISHEFVRHRTMSFAQESTRRITMAA